MTSPQKRARVPAGLWSGGPSLLGGTRLSGVPFPASDQPVVSVGRRCCASCFSPAACLCFVWPQPTPLAPPRPTPRPTTTTARTPQGPPSSSEDHHRYQRTLSDPFFFTVTGRSTFPSSAAMLRLAGLAVFSCHCAISWIFFVLLLICFCRCS